jgi:outer membrane protein assembly factor BamB
MRLLCALLLALVFTPVLLAADNGLVWPQFRGPGGSGIALDEEPTVEVGPETNVKWKVPVPSGLSSPIVVGDKLVVTAFDGGKLYTIAYRRADGSEAWRTEAPFEELEAYHKTEGSPAASTCATDGERIISYFGSCGVFCYDLDGNQTWHFPSKPAKMFGDFGTGVSPILVDGVVILLRDEGVDPKIYALDIATGDLKWEKVRQSRTGYCTPTVWDTPNGKQIAAPGFGQMTGYDLKTGEERWFVRGMPAACTASPVTSDGILYFAAWSPGDPSESSEFKMPTFDELLQQTGDDNGDGQVARDEAKGTGWESFFEGNDPNKNGQIERKEWEGILEYIASSRNSAFALRPGGQGDVTDTHMIWKQTKGLPYVPSAIVYQGQHVMVKDGGIVTAYDTKTGKEIYQRRAIESGSYYASPVAANGNLYFTSLADGTITVLKGGTTAPEVLKKNPPLGERTAATPAIADDTLYVRTANHLWAFAEND